MNKNISNIGNSIIIKKYKNRGDELPTPEELNIKTGSINIYVILFIVLVICLSILLFLSKKDNNIEEKINKEEEILFEIDDVDDSSEEKDIENFEIDMKSKPVSPYEFENNIYKKNKIPKINKIIKIETENRTF